MIRHHGSFEFGIDLTIESEVFCIGKDGEPLNGFMANEPPIIMEYRSVEEHFALYLETGKSTTDA
jgi:hypothetical protein